MNADNHKKLSLSSAYNWKGVMDFIKEEVKSNTSEWTNEKQILIVKFF
jgi:hypothetical protein